MIPVTEEAESRVVAGWPTDYWSATMCIRGVDPPLPGLTMCTRGVWGSSSIRIAHATVINLGSSVTQWGT